MKFDIRMLALSALLISSSAHARVSVETVTTITADDSISSIKSIDQVVDIFVEIITGKRDIIVFERIVAQVDDASLKAKLINFFKEVKTLVRNEGIKAFKIQVIAARQLGVSAAQNLTAKLLKLRKELEANEDKFLEFIKISEIQ